jgi:carboxyl-terminal processing protease
MLRYSGVCAAIGLAFLVAAATGLSAADLSGVARAYLEEALNIMQAHSINRDVINWDRVRAQTYARAAGAQTPPDTYNAIRSALHELQDYHSTFIPSEDAQALTTASLGASASPEGRMMTESIAHLRVPAFAGSAEAAVLYAEILHQTVRSLLEDGAVGWVVDLRGNVGGDMWAMLAGVGPVLGDGACGAFVDPEGITQTWSYHAGAAALDGAAQVTVRADALCPTIEPLAPVAVLIDRQTCSSGEAIAVAHTGRPNARLFGQITCGLSTANEDFTLTDGAILLLTVSTFADRNGTVYGSVVTPDKHVRSYGAQTSGADPVLEAAVEWLTEQEAVQP